MISSDTFYIELSNIKQIFNNNNFSNYAVDEEIKLTEAFMLIQRHH